jgi:biotin synthase
MSQVRPKFERPKSNQGISFEEALEIANQEISDLDDLSVLLARANKLRQQHKGSNVITCSIINAKSGGCPEDCAFCSQSTYHNSEIDRFDLLNTEKIILQGQEAEKVGAKEFSIVTSGKATRDNEEFSTIKDSIDGIKSATELTLCASLGTLDRQELNELKKVGLEIFHHNLETSRSFFPNICSTHSYDENLETIRMAKEAGLRVCCGGIFGMGESWQQRVELLFELKDLGVDSIPINFLNPVKGTRLENQKLLKPLKALKIIALARLINPTANIVICGGREVTLRDLQSWIFFAGANGVLIGNYLTTEGRSTQDDLKMIKDQGLTPVGGYF